MIEAAILGALAFVGLLCRVSRDMGREEGRRQAMDEVRAEASRRAEKAVADALAAADRYKAAGGAQGAAQRGEY